MKSVSMKDIAELCNVSVATVSRVINKNGGYSQETEEKVLKAIEETGFNININAKSLRMNKTFTIGIIIPDITNYFFGELVNYIETLFFKEGFSTIISSTNRDSLKEQSYLKMMISQGVDGIIVISGDQNFTFSDPNINIPYICIDRRPDKLVQTSLVSSDHYQGGFIAAEHFHQRGCSKTIIVINNPNSSSTVERIQGFEAFRKEKAKVIHFDNLEAKIKSETKLSFDSVFAVNDLTALQVIKILNQHKISVPKDVKVIGFDNTPYGKTSNPSLTSIEQNIKSISETVVESLISLINDSKNYQNKIIKFPVKLIVRESTL